MVMQKNISHLDQFFIVDLSIEFFKIYIMSRLFGFRRGSADISFIIVIVLLSGKYNLHDRSFAYFTGSIETS